VGRTDIIIYNPRPEAAANPYPAYITNFIKEFGGTPYKCRVSSVGISEMEVKEEREGTTTTRTWYRLKVSGATPIRNTSTETYERMHGGICFHACRSEQGLRGIMTDGHVKAMPYRANDPMCGAGDHGFYGLAIHNEDVQQNTWAEYGQSGEDWAKNKMQKIFNWCCRHHHDTGVVVELVYRAEKKVIDKGCLEAETVKAGIASKFKTGKDGGERWCFWEEDATIVAIWVGPHRVDAETGARSSVTAPGQMPAWMQDLTKRPEQTEKQEKGKKRPAEKEEHPKEAKRWYFMCILLCYEIHTGN